MTGADEDFTWQEALWVAKITPKGQDATFEFNAWPLDDLMECGSYVSQLEDRVCGSFTGDCGVNVRADRDSACTETESGWWCEDSTGHPLPAIKTRLKKGYIEALYDNCP
jgi:hypothetical protein